MTPLSHKVRAVLNAPTVARSLRIVRAAGCAPRARERCVSTRESRGKHA